MKFKHYCNNDYEAVCGFLIELNRENQNHINWNWARFEWMMEHPEFDKSLKESIGLWMDGEKVVGAAIYDMYFGEAFCCVLPGYEALYPEILAYAYRELRDDNGLGIAICDDNEKEIKAAFLHNFPIIIPLRSLTPRKNHMLFNGCCGRALTTGQIERNLNVTEILSLKSPCSASILIPRSVSRRKTATENMFPIAVCGTPIKPTTPMSSLSARYRHAEAKGSQKQSFMKR